MSWIDLSYDTEGNKLRLTKSSSSTGTEYIGPFVYEGSTLKQVNTSEGRVTYSGGAFTYEYHIKDHLGNVRVAFIDDLGSPLVVQKSN